MKARVIKRDTMYQLLLCNGIIKTLQPHEVAEFLKTYGDESHYKGAGSWDYAVSMEEFEGETMAIVTEENFLVIQDAEFFNSVMEVKTIKYISLREYAEKYNKNYSYLRRLVSAGSLPGAVKKGKMWFMPEDAGCPKDRRESWYRKKENTAAMDNEFIKKSDN